MSLKPIPSQNSVSGASFPTQFTSTGNSDSSTYLKEKSDISTIQSFSSETPDKNLSSSLPKSTRENVSLISSEAGSDRFSTSHQNITKYSILTKKEFYSRFRKLADLEEELADKGEELSSREVKELKALTKLIEKDNNTILFTKEIVEIEKNDYYYVQFDDTAIRINNLKDQIQNTLKIQDPDEMAKKIAKETWYKNGIMYQTTSDYLDAIEALKNAHKINIDLIKMVKKLEALQTDVIVSDIYPILKTLFLNFFKLQQIQKVFNHSCSKRAAAMLKMYNKAFSHEWSAQKISENEKVINADLQLEEEKFRLEHENTRKLVLSIFEKIKEEIDKLSPSASYKAFIVGLDSRKQETGRRLAASSSSSLIGTLDLREFNSITSGIEKTIRINKKTNEFNKTNTPIPVSTIESNCSGSILWIMERADIKQLSNMQQAFGSLFHSIELIDSNWKIKTRIINEKSTQSNAFAEGKNKYKTEILFLQGQLDRIFYLHATCIQKRRHNMEIDAFYKKENELLDQKISLMDRGSKMLICNSKSQQYLICTEDPIEVQDQKNHKDSQLSFTDQSNHERAVWDFIDERNGGIMLRNAISKCYLKCSPQSREPNIAVVGNPQTNSNNKHATQNIQAFEGLWKIKKMHDHILETEKESNKKF